MYVKGCKRLYATVSTPTSTKMSVHVSACTAPSYSTALWASTDACMVESIYMSSVDNERAENGVSRVVDVGLLQISVQG